MALISVFDWNDPWLTTSFRPSSLLSTFDSIERQLNGLQRHCSRPAAHSMLQKNAVRPTVVEEDDGTKKVRWSFDVSGFKPENVSIRTQDGKLEVKAKHEDKTDHYEQFREYTRIVAIPEGTGLEEMASKLSEKGLLTIDAPYTPPAVESKETTLPVKHE